MDTQEVNIDTPHSILNLLDREGLNHSPLRAGIQSDINMSGGFGGDWVLASDERLTIVRGDSPPQVIWSVRIQDVDKFRVCPGVGSGMLQYLQGGVWTDLTRFSNALDDRFQALVTGLQHYRENGQWRMPDAEGINSRRCPTCHFRLPSVGETCPHCLPRGAILARVMELIRPQRRGAMWLMGFTVLGVIAELIPPKLQQYMVDDVLRVGADGTAAEGFFRALLVVVLCLAASRVMLAVVAAMKGRLATRIGAALTANLRSQLVQRLQQLPVSYFDRHQVGSLMSRVAYDSEVLYGLVHQITAGFLLQILQLVGVGIMLIAINPKLALFTLIPVPLVIGSSWFFWRRIYPRYYRYWDSTSKQVAALSSMLSGIRVVKAFSQEPREFERFQNSSRYLRDSRLEVEESTASYSAWMQIVFSLGGLIVWYVGGRDVLGKSMTLGSLIAFLAYLAMFYAPLATLSNFTTWLTSFLTGAKRVLELLDTPVTIREPENPAQVGPARGWIAFDNVRFGYDRHQSVIRGVSFEVQPGEMVGIVGRSGSGKTTLVNLLGRFYDVDDGAIRVDGVDVREYASGELRRRIGIVFQETYLFRGTIWENLAYGVPDVSFEAGLKATKAARAHDFILRSPLGYETLLGERGAGLSGGEKQRLSLARALLYDPPILVLDEATSNIDTEAEKMIQEALVRLTRGRTTIAIAHRLSTLRNANRILVFDRGHLAEQGTHDELLKSDGIYARMVKIQTQVTKHPSIDRLLSEELVPTGGGEAATGDGNRNQEKEAEEGASDAIQWLQPELGTFEMRSQGGLTWIPVQGDARSGLFLVRCFPASLPDGYLSVRQWDADGDDEEVGMIRSLATWPAQMAQLLADSLHRRYLFRTILGIDELESRQGYLFLTVQTPEGEAKFTMRWAQSQATDFGKRGKVLHDVEENWYLVPDVEQLPAADQDRFRRYIYW
jgi:ATP-binding cassette, subfamily B, bacterial